VTAALLSQIIGSAATVATVVITWLSTRGKVREVHTIVNSQRDTLLARVDQLVQSLEKAGIDIPDKPGSNVDGKA
jgi:hypothetical protein